MNRFVHPHTLIVSLNLNINLTPQIFCRDGIHFSFYGNGFFTNFLANIIYKFFRLSDTAVLPQMATQTHCLICRNNLRGGGVWCFTCPGYMHVKCSGLARSIDHYDNFSCHRCISQFHSTNDTHECNLPTLATTTLPQIHPQPSTAPHTQNSREAATLETRTETSYGEKTSPQRHHMVKDCKKLTF